MCLRKSRSKKNNCVAKKKIVLGRTLLSRDHLKCFIPYANTWDLILPELPLQPPALCLKVADNGPKTWVPDTHVGNLNAVVAPKFSLGKP